MIQEIAIELLYPNPFQPRQSQSDPALEELASDIQRNGLIQPPVVRAVNGCYQIVCGHRRVEACRRLGWKTIVADVRELSDQDMALVAWSENEARQALNPLDRALAIQRMMIDFGWTQEEAGRHLGLARPTVANILRLLDLRPEVQEALRAGRISERQALALAPLSELQWDKTDGWVHRRVRDILAGKHQASSDEIRKLMKAAREEASRPLSPAVFDQEECAGCPSRKNSRCFNVECFDQKRRETMEKILLLAQQETGIPRWDKDESVKPMTMSPGAVRVAQERQCPNLRLVASPYSTQPAYACVLGRECKCDHEAGEAFSQEIRQKNEERRALIERLANCLANLMRDLDERVLRVILVLLSPPGKPGEELALQVARAMAIGLVGYSHWEEASRVMQDLLEGQ